MWCGSRSPGTLDTPRLRRTRHESRGLELAPERSLTVFGYVDHDDAGATVRLPDDRLVFPKDALGYARGE